MRRLYYISRSILRAIFFDVTADKRTILSRILAFFHIFQITLGRYKDELFKKLRIEAWHMDEDEYTESFQGPYKGEELRAIGDLGYCGSVCPDI